MYFIDSVILLDFSTPVSNQNNLVFKLKILYVGVKETLE